jgi:hypothetical protein
MRDTICISALFLISTFPMDVNGQVRELITEDGLMKAINSWEEISHI